MTSSIGHRQMDKTIMDQISGAIRRMNPGKFGSCTDQYLKGVVAKEEPKKAGLFRKLRFSSSRSPFEEGHAGLDQEAAALLSLSKQSLNHMMKLRFTMNGQYKEMSETDREQTRLYVKRLRHQQLDLLMGIYEETETIQHIIRQVRDMRDITQSHLKIIREAAIYMRIISERISQQAVPLLPDPAIEQNLPEPKFPLPVPGDPTTEHQERLGTEQKECKNLPEFPEPEKPNSGDNWPLSLKPEPEWMMPANDAETIRQVTRTFREIRECEDISGPDMSGESGPARAIGICHDLVQDTAGDIDQRKKRIIERLKELKQGWKLLKKLAQKGYSDQMQPELEILLNQHDARRYDFQRLVRESRTSFEELTKIRT